MSISTIDYSGIGYYITGFIFSWLFLVIAGKYQNISHSCPTVIIKKEHLTGQIYLIISFLFLWMIPAIRGHVGLDFDAYLHIFNSTNSLDDVLKFKHEPGFSLSILLIKFLGGNFYTLMFLYSLGTGYLFWRSLYKDCANMTIAIFGIIAINYYFMPISVIRQFFANAIVLTSIPAINNRQLVKFIIILFISICFHYTSIIFVLLYLIVPAKNKKNAFTVKGIFLVFIIIFCLIYLQNILTFIMPHVIEFKSNYSFYFNNNSTRSIFSLISILPTAIFALLFYHRLIAYNYINRVYVWMSILMVIMHIVGYIAPAFSRLHYYFDFCIPVLLSFSTKIFQKQLKPIYFTMSLILFIYMITKILQYQSNDFLPYQTFFDK